ncbi:MAG: cupin domain-containing protein [Deltaproteobacteria bacterium]|nr:cupin domain-containing protein [Deltaproteobacteria bacterium]
MSFINLTDVKEKEIIPGFRGRMLHSEHMTFVLWNITSGSSLPEHSHFHEQITTVIKGTFEMTVDGETQIIAPGSVVIIPPNVKHKGKSITDTQLIDAFYPVRDDYR